VKETPKSKLKDVLPEETQSNFQPIRFLNGAISFHGAREDDYQRYVTLADM